MNLPELNQYKKIINESIELLKLDLSGLTVLTEVGTGSFLFTPVIAALANAKKIFASTNDSSYGKADEVIKECKEALTIFNIKTPVEFISNARPIEAVKVADIITNSAHIRPLDKELLTNIKATCVIPLMYEKWELRQADIDIEFCKQKGIKVAGTWENYPALKIFDYCEQLIVKMVFEAGYEIAQNNILVWSNDHFGKLAQKGFLANGASSVKKVFAASDVYSNAAKVDFVFFCDYLDKRKLIGENATINLDTLQEINPSIGIVHLSGDVDNEFANKKNIKIYPDKKGQAVRMTFTLAHIGKRPTILLNTAGLKVGECLAREIKSDLVQEL